MQHGVDLKRCDQLWLHHVTRDTRQQIISHLFIPRHMYFSDCSKLAEVVLQLGLIEAMW